MPYNATVPVTKDGEWELLTKGGAITGDLDLIVNGTFYIAASVGQVKPSSLNGAQLWPAGSAQMGTTMAKLFPGLSGANHLWAWIAAGIPADVNISYA